MMQADWRSRESAQRACRAFGMAMLVSVAGVCALALAPSEAAAQRRGAPQTIVLGEEKLEGRLQKPEAFYILQHASLNYERLDPRDSFIPELVKSVKEEAFE